MSDLVRAGVVLAVLGLSLATLWAVAFGAVAASTEIHCVDAARAYSLDAVDPLTATVRVDDGCNAHLVARPVVAGLTAAVAGGVVGGAGLTARALDGGS